MSGPRVEEYWLPKRGSTKEEYEDAIRVNKRGLRFAVADGASESSFAGLWARLLVESFAQGRLCRRSPSTFPRDVSPLRRQWQQEIRGRSLPWYAELKAAAGAFAAFVGLKVRRSRKAWWAIAVGDCCLFLIRQGRLERAFPIESVEGFPSRPFLLHSLSTSGVDKQLIHITEGDWQPGDTFLLMSDALATYFLTALASSQTPDSLLSFDRTPQGFISWITDLRDDHLIRNDDVSLVIVSYAPAAT